MRAAEAAPHAGEPWIDIAGIHARAGNLAQAMADLTVAVGRDPELGEAWAQRAVLKADRKDWAGAAEDALHAVNSDGSNGLWMASLALYRVHAGDEGGLAILNDLVRGNPRNTLLLTFQSEALQAAGRPVEALAALDKALEIRPEAGVYAQRSGLRITARDFDGAMADADHAARMAPDSATALNQVCWARAVAGRELDVALAACNRALALASNHHALLDSRGLVELRQGRFQEAWNDYDAALRQAPDNAAYLYGRGLAATRLGRLADGQADFARAGAKEPGTAAEYAGYGLTPSDAFTVPGAAPMSAVASSAASGPSAAPAGVRGARLEPVGGVLQRDGQTASGTAKSIVTLADGGRSGEAIGDQCVGMLSDRPHLRLRYQAGDKPLFVSAISAFDATLVVRGPDDAVSCDDDGGMGHAPMVRFDRPISGDYDIWVGALELEPGMKDDDAELWISEADPFADY